MRNIRIGAVNWDCSLPRETYFGYHQTYSLSPKKYRTVTPYYADIIGENEISYHSRDQEEYDRELSYAIEAGIDYFAYVWYGEEGSKNHIQKSPSDCSHKVYELTYARKMHYSSELREKIHFCAIAGAHPFSDGDIRELVITMKESCYEKIAGRPLLYVFNGKRMDFITRVRKMCEELQVKQPYVVPMYNFAIDPTEDYSGVEALSAYACTKPGSEFFAQHSELVIEENESRRKAGLPVIPTFSVGWNPSPRLERPVPWVNYKCGPYIKFATKEELLQGAEDFVVWIKTKAKTEFLDHILVYAWNEFEEGGMICPLLNADCEIDVSRLKAFKEVSKYFKEELKNI